MENPRNSKMFEGMHFEDWNTAEDEGIRIIKELIKKYPPESVQNCDIILNSLAVALAHLFLASVEPSDYPYIQQVLHKSITEYLKMTLLMKKRTKDENDNNSI